MDPKPDGTLGRPPAAPPSRLLSFISGASIMGLIGVLAILMLRDPDKGIDAKVQARVKELDQAHRDKFDAQLTAAMAVAKQKSSEVKTPITPYPTRQVDLVLDQHESDEPVSKKPAVRVDNSLASGPIISIGEEEMGGEVEEDLFDPITPGLKPPMEPPLAVQFRSIIWRECEWVVLADFEDRAVSFCHSPKCKYCAARHSGQPYKVIQLRVNGQKIPEAEPQVVPEDLPVPKPDPVPGPEPESDVQDQQTERDDQE